MDMCGLWKDVIFLLSLFLLEYSNVDCVLIVIYDDWNGGVEVQTQNTAERGSPHCPGVYTPSGKTTMNYTSVT